MKGKARKARATGCLIVFEGVSGSGKSEGINRLTRELVNRGVTVSVAEWNANPVIRRLVRILDVCRIMNPAVYSLLQWIGFHRSYQTLMKPRLKRGEVVIADRYIYTGMARDNVNGAAGWIGRPWYTGAPLPDLIVFCDTPPAVCFHRIALRGKALYHPSRKYQLTAEPHKELLYLENMRECYLKLFAEASGKGQPPPRIVQDFTAAEVLGDVWALIERKQSWAASREIATTADRQEQAADHR
ncbi:dTMP kinase [Gorillibacterium timonense]|uniref:dTMP kinase n=1 Tax=Gorillibacterium timonense TaxID=1689269 RepID=UPI00071D89D9|nr:AAA family ATPase [Gorillibacterium timonense]